jgi:outer membrane protein OmpA-like peptidoglycan-associated protein
VKEFIVPYDFDGLVGFSHPRYISEVLDFARSTKARTIEIVGYRGAVRLSNGQTMTESATIGKRRAEQIAMLLRGAGLDSPTYTVSWHEGAEKATGVDDHLNRRVVVTVRR